MSIRNTRRTAAGLVMALAAGLGALADETKLTRGVGRSVPNFTLKDTEDRTISLYGYFGKKAVVLVFTGVECPVGNLYMPRLAELAKTYQARGVAFVAINSNAHESAEQVAEHAKSFGLPFPVLKDKDNVVADQCLVERTCEVLVVDSRARLRYRGAIDDQYGVGSRKEAPKNNYLAAALDALLDGRQVPVKATEVSGCPIERVEAKPVAKQTGPRVRAAAPEILEALKEREAPVEVGKVTYAGDVASILQARCQSCHRPGQVGPFSLLTYDDARRWAGSIREVVEDRRMPPWHADPRYGHFENDRRLTARERATLLAWVDQATPLGDPKDVPPPRTFTEGWSIGTPDVVFEVSEPYEVAAQGVLPYQHFQVSTNFREDKWVQAIEARPGDSSVVHHIIVYVDDHGKTPGRGDRRMGTHLVGFAPGDLPSIYPAGTAKRIPAGSDLIFQIHYTPVGKAKTDRSSVAMIFAKEPPTHEAITHGIVQHKFAIPPDADNFRVTSTWTSPNDAHLLNMMPHMHLRGKDFKYTATYPDGTTEVLLSVPAYDFGWQSMYRLTEPKALPKGTRIDCEAHFDNSAGNPNNPDPSKLVRWGEQTFEEMMIGYIDYRDDAPVNLNVPAEKTPVSSRTVLPPSDGLVRASRTAPSGSSDSP